MADPSITIRVSPETKEKILELVDSGEYRSITDFIDRAIREKLDRDKSGDVTKEILDERLKKLENR